MQDSVSSHFQTLFIWPEILSSLKNDIFISLSSPYLECLMQCNLQIICHFDAGYHNYCITCVTGNLRNNIKPLREGLWAVMSFLNLE